VRTRTSLGDGAVNREYHRWHSPSLGRQMELLVFGHAGARLLVFPTSMGRFYEWEDRGMVGALHHHIAHGWLQLFCVDSVDGESWYDRRAHPGARAWRHVQYEHYLLHEVLPFIHARNRTPFLITTGASFGAYHAVNLAFRHPFLVGRVVAMSGLYDIKRLTDGYEDDNVYRNDPSHYLIHEHDHARLEALRRMDIIIALGTHDPNRRDSEHLSNVLWSKGVWHAFRLWDGWCHDWPWWRQMIVRYVGGHD
jgi:esterase/lipase superfamily enzyme